MFSSICNKKNMGDLASAITCPMCMVQYDTSSNEPRNLKCNHTFCRCCITSLTSKAKRDCQPCRCPTCRAEIIWDSEIPVAIQFPMNFALCNVVDACAIPEFSFKVILIGDGGVGKTTLLRKHLFPDDTRLPSVTLGANFITETILRSGKHLKIQYWDTAGQERVSLF
ncbi:hypothetical protein Pelo_7152 [Pelomyxa schiedti]|nr:hypothetical protein Pelo_7152 [Pelomyxa schiedti]